MSEHETKALKLILSHIRDSKGEVPAPRVLKRKSVQARNKAAKLQAKSQQVHKLQVAMNDSAEPQWSFKYDKKVLKRETSALEVVVQSQSKRIEKLVATLTQKTMDLRNMVRKMKRLGDRGDGRKQLLSLLTAEQQEEVAANHSFRRVFNKGKYIDIANNYCPGLLSKYNLSGNVTRGNLYDTFKLYVSSKSEYVKRLRIMNFRLIGKKAVARAAVIRDKNLERVQGAESICVCMDGSEREKLNHKPLAETHLERDSRDPANLSDGKVCRSLLSDSTTAGKSGKDQAQHIVGAIGLKAAKRSSDAVLFDTTSSNTGCEHGLRAELELMRRLTANSRSPTL